MKCQWQEIINILPLWMRQSVDEFGKNDMLELRLRLGDGPQIVMKNKSVWLERTVTSEDISFCINTATKYSPWTSGSITEGFVTAPGGHRIGICGSCVYEANRLRNISNITSVCIRVSRDFYGIAKSLYHKTGSILIIGAPGSGKTTFLRDLVRGISNSSDGCITVLDERRELFPICSGGFCFSRGKKTDVMSGCKKSEALEMALRTMGPSVIALDEITGEEDCKALLNAAWCGVRLIATAHAANMEELQTRTIYKSLLDNNIFSTLITVHPDKSWQEEQL